MSPVKKLGINIKKGLNILVKGGHKLNNTLK